MESVSVNGCRDGPGYLAHTLVKLTLCNGCYLITENGRGRNQVSLCSGGNQLSDSSGVSAQLLLAEEAVVVLWSALFMLSLLVPQQKCQKLLIVPVTVWCIWGKANSREMSTSTEQRKEAPPTETWKSSTENESIKMSHSIWSIGNFGL